MRGSVSAWKTSQDLECHDHLVPIDDIENVIHILCLLRAMLEAARMATFSLNAQELPRM